MFSVRLHFVWGWGVVFVLFFSFEKEKIHYTVILALQRWKQKEQWGKGLIYCYTIPEKTLMHYIQMRKPERIYVHQ